jgi:hypothetical protein
MVVLPPLVVVEILEDARVGVAGQHGPDLTPLARRGTLAL